ncbi:hypothetical protein DEAC_c20880 [Desulfosporosinus acididurans]|uniref:DUF2628 domain-containing protein n=1 Tax=Desulfosporosinus acididurans TaxID=476652 RepID=A0A0J1FRE7_9FIRM|nr:DUF2628 domain-containing protein [Desulfosporosinus acididurans]KLU66049.1 hypothetical protein DEAC_c20880 [Desulfosporosinus acididurans]
MDELHNTEEIGEQELRFFVKKNSDYYLAKWSLLDSGETQKRKTWNWAALLIGVLWLGYRKMYRYVFICFTGFFLIDIISLITKVNIDKFIGIILAAVLCIEGNRFYYIFTKKKLNQIMAKTSDPDLQRSQIMRLGGTSWIGVLVVVLLLCVEVVFVTEIKSFLR